MASEAVWLPLTLARELLNELVRYTTMQPQIPTIASIGTRQRRGFTLMEVVFSLAIIVVVFSGVIVAYTQASYRAEWTGYSLAAESLAIKQIEQARCARWDPAGADATTKFELFSLNLQNSNVTAGVLTGYTWTNLDLPSAGNLNSLRATNYVTVSPVAPTGNLNASNIMVRVDTVWAFTWKKTKLYTNTVCTYLAPDNKDPSDLFGN
jgi:prepilin-type N-terminal cleavage/methylation domain-containing protein